MVSTVNQIGLGLSGQSGSGFFAGDTGAIFVTPTLGAALATSLNFGGSTLSSYINGTWTPTFAFATAGDLSVSYATRSGVYMRIGNILVLTAEIVCTPTFTTSSGLAQITGIPTAPASGINPRGSIGIGGASLAYPTSYTFALANLTAGTTTIQINSFGASLAISNFTAANFTTATSVSLYLNVTYTV